MVLTHGSCSTNGKTVCLSWHLKDASAPAFSTWPGCMNDVDSSARSWGPPQSGLFPDYCRGAVLFHAANSCRSITHYFSSELSSLPTDEGVGGTRWLTTSCLRNWPTTLPPLKLLHSRSEQHLKLWKTVAQDHPDLCICFVHWDCLCNEKRYIKLIYYSSQHTFLSEKHSQRWCPWTH